MAGKLVLDWCECGHPKIIHSNAGLGCQYGLSKGRMKNPKWEKPVLKYCPCMEEG